MAGMLYKHVNYKLENLILDIESGKLGLPDLQRPFVWPNTKIRDLFDSMMKGYPIGFLMLWDSPDDPDKSKQIGSDNKEFESPKYLIIDGQQRLTSLFAVMRGIEVKDSKFKKKRINISFNPVTRSFRVGDSATNRAAEWIYDISEVFKNKNKIRAYINGIIDTIKLSRTKVGGVLDDAEEEKISTNITDLISLTEYIVPTLEISDNTDEESISDIFVRVNSGGEKLNENDFILTLISVYWQEGRQKIERFCESATVPATGTAFNHLIAPKATHIIRVTMAYGFQRATLRYAYMLLRGRDFDKGIYSESLRIQKFTELKTVLDEVLNVQTWHDFIKCAEAAGFISNKLISSENALIYSYAMYLIGKHNYHLDNSSLRKVIAKWFFMTSVSGYYTDSPESKMETDLADLRNVKDGGQFVSFLESKITSIFTNDYFETTLPTGAGGFTSSASNSPAWFGYCAALNILDVPGLFSTLHTRELFSFASSGTKSALEKHHLFPKAYLKSIGIEDNRDRNQIANFAFIEWHDNLEILDTSPAVYMKDRLAAMSEGEKAAIYEVHALPEGWENMSYNDFLAARRVLMARVIRKGYERLKQI
ncbi:MAG: DUF262 domain-containing protein [Azoarcus sp.]|jgi:hypothetical protein|nr:DUF262 domain-containing protein [Azoarcus sp.]